MALKGHHLGIVGDVIAALDRAFTGFSEVVDAFTEGAEQAQQQLKDLEKFDFDPKFKIRVISIPRAIEGFQDLWDTIRDELLGKFKSVVDESEQIIETLKNLPARAPGEPILQHASLVLQFIHAFNDKLAKLIRDILDFTETIDNIKKRIETLDDLFLPQDSKKIVEEVSYPKRQK